MNNKKFFISLATPLLLLLVLYFIPFYLMKSDETIELSMYSYQPGTSDTIPSVEFHFSEKELQQSSTEENFKEIVEKTEGTLDGYIIFTKDTPATIERLTLHEPKNVPYMRATFQLYDDKFSYDTLTINVPVGKALQTYSPHTPNKKKEQFLWDDKATDDTNFFNEQYRWLATIHLKNGRGIITNLQPVDDERTDVKKKE